MSTKLLEEHTFDTGVVSMNVAEGPRSGPPLVLLHGGSGRWQSYRWLLEGLTRRWHVFAPDLRGHGSSSWTPGNYRLWDYVTDVIALLEEVVAEPAAIAGHSLGGEIAIIVGSERPDLVHAIVAIDAPLSAEETWRTVGPDRERLAWMRSLHALTPDRVAAALRDVTFLDASTGRTVRAGEYFGEDSGVFDDDAETLLRNDPAMLDAVIEFDEMHAGYAAERLLPLIRCPVLLLLGDPEHGSAVSLEHADRAMLLLLSGRVVRVPKTSHGLVWENTPAVLAAMDEFLTSVSAERRDR